MVLLISFVPHAGVEHGSRGVPAFRPAQEAGGEGSAKVLSDAYEGACDIK